ncbi:hypothetical protein BOTBODRAFT_122386, partial [Botryobasidium botryosum FD-172 SS1]
MLEFAGVQPANLNESDNASSLTLCEECYSSLQKGKIPHFALKNHLYRGLLPEDLQDLTWVEEMVCALHRTTAHVTRLYHYSTSEKDPFLFHGNTCAHDMNVISTASVLPRAPSNLLDQLSVVFVGPGPVKKEHLGVIFRVRKAKVWRFLLWLKENNRLYSTLIISQENLDMYEEDGTIPGLLEAVIHDK